MSPQSFLPPPAYAAASSAYMSSLPPDLAIASSDCYRLLSLLPPRNFLPLHPILDSEQDLDIGQELDGWQAGVGWRVGWRAGAGLL